MNNLFKSAIALLALGLMSGLTSCEEEEEEPYINIISVTSCSPDLLEFVIPTVTITADNGKSVSFVLNASDFEESEAGLSNDYTLTINGVSVGVTSVKVNNIAKRPVRYDDCESIKGTITVNYALKDNIAMEKDSYIFYHDVAYDYDVRNEKGGGPSAVGNYAKPYQITVSKKNVEEYLQQLVSEGDNTTFSESSISITLPKQHSKGV